MPRKRVALLSVVWNVHSYYADGTYVVHVKIGVSIQT